MQKKIKIFIMVALFLLLVNLATIVAIDTNNSDVKIKPADATTQSTVHKEIKKVNTISKDNSSMTKSKNTKEDKKSYDIKTYKSFFEELTRNSDENIVLNIENDLLSTSIVNVNPEIKSIIINGHGHTINGNNLGFLRLKEVNLTLNNITLKNCDVDQFGESNRGGAIYAYMSNITIENTQLINNKAQEGGAIYSLRSNITIQNTTLTQNNATRCGGAIYSHTSNIKIQNTTLTGNNATGIYEGRGGAIYSHNSNIIIQNSTLTHNNATEWGGSICAYKSFLSLQNALLANNTAKSGGAIISDNSNSSVKNTHFTNNTALGGGAILGYGMGNLIISNSNLNYNTATLGGTIESISTNITIENTTLTHNSGESRGRVIYSDDSNMTIQNTDIINNSVIRCGAIYNGAKSTLTIIKSNITHNAATFERTIENYGTLNITNSNITKTRVKITLNSIKGIIGEKITLTANITDEYGNPISGGNLAFKLNGKTLRTDGRFDSKAPAMKFAVKDGKVTYIINADLYLRNTKNVTAAYSGTYKFEETRSKTVEAQIQKRKAGVTVTVQPTQNKQYDTIKFTATVRDVTRNGKNQTLINQDTKVMFKVNGNTLKDKVGNIVYVPVDANKQATYNYTIPAGTGGIMANKQVRDYKVEAILVGNNYYPGSGNSSKFNVERSPTTATIIFARVTRYNLLFISATLKDFKGNNLIGTNKVTVKINGKTYIDPKNGKPKYWNVKNGDVNLSIQSDPSRIIERVMLVTEERQAYLEGRAETTFIIAPIE